MRIDLLAPSNWMMVDTPLKRTDSIIGPQPMKNSSTAFEQLYQAELRTHLAQRARPKADIIGKIGAKAKSSAIPVLEITKIHERFIVMDLLPACAISKQATLIRRAGEFFVAVVATTRAGTTPAHDVGSLNKTIGALSCRNIELASANKLLDLEIVRHAENETALRKSECDCKKALKKSEVLKERLRGLSRKLLSAQEDERKKISRELHDVIAQSLAGINIRLAALKTENGTVSKKLVRNISLTQKMVTNSTDIVHKFARELRPAVLDHLGLIPALHSFMTHFMNHTGVRTHLTVFQAVESLSAAKRTILYRVAQEALTNVGRHAHASRADVIIQMERKFVRMEIIDNGISFQVDQKPRTRGAKRLGILGMRERVEMIGGHFKIESTPETGTKIIAQIPITRAIAKKMADQVD